MKKILLLALLSNIFVQAAETPKKAIDKSSFSTDMQKQPEFAFFENMPLDATKHVIIPKLSVKDLVSFGKTSKKHNQIIQDELKKRTPEFSDEKLIQFAASSDKHFDLAKNELEKRLPLFSNEQLIHLAKSSNNLFELANTLITKRISGQAVAFLTQFKKPPNSETFYLNFSPTDEQNLTCILPGVFESHSRFKKLTQLNIRNTEITCLFPETFKGLQAVKFLTLAQNELTKIYPGAFKGLDNLINLKILVLFDTSKLETLENGTFEGLGNLKILKVNNYKNLVSIDDKAFEGAENLEHIDLRNNNLKKITPKAFSSLKQLKTLKLYGNPIAIEIINKLRKALPKVKITH